MKKIYSISLHLLIMQSCVYATVDEALNDWYVKIDPSVTRTPAYSQGYSDGYAIGQAMSLNDSVTFLKPWVYLHGTQENQKNCTMDATLNNVIASIQRSAMYNALAIKEQIQETIASAPGTIATSATQTVKNIPGTVRGYASSAGSKASDASSRLWNWFWGQKSEENKQEALKPK